MRLVERLVREHRVAVMPGSTFGVTDRCDCEAGPYGPTRSRHSLRGHRATLCGLRTIPERMSRPCVSHAADSTLSRRTTGWLRHVEALIDAVALPPGTLLLFPEMFATGFTMNSAAVAEPIDGPTVSFLSDLAAEAQDLRSGRYRRPRSGRCATAQRSPRVRSQGSAVSSLRQDAPVFVCWRTNALHGR